MSDVAKPAAERPLVRVVAAAIFDGAAPIDPRHMAPVEGVGRQHTAAYGAEDRPHEGPMEGAGRCVLIAERPPGKHMAGRWEFPGGKVGPGETDIEALRRELTEELGIERVAARPCMALTHAYADRTVELSLWVVDRYEGVPRPLDGQRLKWVPVGRLQAEDILEADRPFVEALQALEAAQAPGLTPGR